MALTSLSSSVSLSSQSRLTFTFPPPHPTYSIFPPPPPPPLPSLPLGAATVTSHGYEDDKETAFWERPFAQPLKVHHTAVRSAADCHTAALTFDSHYKFDFTFI